DDAHPPAGDPPDGERPGDRVRDELRVSRLAPEVEGGWAEEHGEGDERGDVREEDDGGQRERGGEGAPHRPDDDSRPGAALALPDGVPGLPRDPAPHEAQGARAHDGDQGAEAPPGETPHEEGEEPAAREGLAPRPEREGWGGHDPEDRPGDA